MIASFRWLSLIVLLAASFFANAQTVNTGNQSSWTPNDLDLRILEVRVKQYSFDDVIPAYQFEDIVLLPLAAISQLIDVAIDVRGDIASGFVLKESRTLYLDTARAEITRQGVISAYDADKVHVLFNDIYVDSNLLGDWFDMTFDVDLFAARITIQSDQPLPFQQRLERDKRIAQAMGRLQQQPEYPRHIEPYRNWSMPFVDQTIRLGQRKLSSGESSSSLQLTTFATADLAKLEASLYFSGSDQDKSEDFRLSFGRKDPDAGLLGKLNATEFSFGHLVEPGLSLINQPSSLEPGVSVSSFPLGRQTEFDRHRFIGDLLPGWEVELYRNNALIGYQAEQVNGQYDFPNVPLLFGNNHFRLMFYGPQGQIRVEESHFDLNQSLTRVGEGYYRATITDDDLGDSRAILQYDRGINKRLSATANIASIPLLEGIEVRQHDYLNLGLRSYWDSFFVTADATNDLDGGDAFELNIQTRLGGTIFGLTETVFNEFFSEEFQPNALELERRSELSIDTAIAPGLLPRLAIGFKYDVDEFVGGATLTSFSNQISTNARGFAISNSLLRQQLSGQDPTTTGSLQLSSNYSGVRWRSSLNYTLDPKSEFTGVAVTLNPRRIGNYRLTYDLSHSLDQDLTDVGISANRASGKYNLNMGARVNSDDDVSIDVSLSMSFGHEPRSQQWFNDARAMANNGSVSARAFLDNDQDGVFSPGDEAVPDIGFRLNGGYSRARTDDDGVAFLTGLPAHQSLNVSISPETVVDPAWVPAIEGLKVVPRPGYSMQLDFPIQVSGEIDGTVYVEKDGKQFGVGRVQLELVDTAGRVVKTASTAYDGFYIISAIAYGRYQLRVSAQQQSELGLIVDRTENLSIDAENLFLNGFDFVLRSE